MGGRVGPYRLGAGSFREVHLRGEGPLAPPDCQDGCGTIRH
jgi:hypothetical protein